MRFGEYLVAEGRLLEGDLGRALAEQRRRQVPIGLLAMHSGMMRPEHVHRVLRTQCRRRTWRRFGDLAVELDLLDAESLEILLRNQVSSRPRLGELLVDEGMVPAEYLPVLLDDFHATRLSPQRQAAYA